MLEKALRPVSLLKKIVLVQILFMSGFTFFAGAAGGLGFADADPDLSIGIPAATAALLSFFLLYRATGGTEVHSTFRTCFFLVLAWFLLTLVGVWFTALWIPRDEVSHPAESTVWFASVEGLLAVSLSVVSWKWERDANYKASRDSPPNPNSM